MKLIRNGISRVSDIVSGDLRCFQYSYLSSLLTIADIFTVKRRLRDYRREMSSRTTVDFERGLRGRSGRVVLTAIVM